MMPGSLDRLFAGMAETLRDTVLPAVDEPYARAQVAACIELLGNLATRVEWRLDHLQLVTERADAALVAAFAQAPELAPAVAIVAATSAPGASPVRRRDDALARVAAALRWLDDQPEQPAAAPLLAFATWHVGHEVELLRTGMFRS